MKKISKEILASIKKLDMTKDQVLTWSQEEIKRQKIRELSGILSGMEISQLEDLIRGIDAKEYDIETVRDKGVNKNKTQTKRAVRKN